jgi:hypothetical protein
MSIGQHGKKYFQKERKFSDVGIGSIAHPLLDNAAIMATFLSCLLVHLCVQVETMPVLACRMWGGGRSKFWRKKYFSVFYPCWTIRKKAGKYMQAAAVFVISQVERIRLLRLDRPIR